jgi:hypothetical protein
LSQGFVLIYRDLKVSGSVSRPIAVDVSRSESRLSF